MSDIDERLAALEEFAARMVRLTPPVWPGEEGADIIAATGQDPARLPVMVRLIQLIQRGQLRRQHYDAAVAAQQASAPPLATDQNTILRRNTLLLDWFEREVNISRSYTTVLTTIAYAGLLAIWAGFKDHLDKTSVLVSGALAAVSLIVLVIYEMAKANEIVVTSRDFAQVVAEKFYSADFETAVGQVKARSFSRTNAINRNQPIVFWLSTATGILAGAILIVAGVLEASGITIALP